MNNSSIPPQGETYLYDASGAGAPPVSMGVWFKAAWRHKWLMLLILALVVGAGVFITHLMKPVYEATAMLSFNERPSAGAFPIVSNERVTQDFLNAQISLMMRAATLSEIAHDPDLGLPRSGMFQGEPNLAEALRERLNIQLLKNTTILSVGVQGTDPKLITAIANKVADYQRVQVEGSRDADTRNSVSEYVKKMADMSSEMDRISKNIWARANSAAIPGLTFNEQQKDGRVIVAAFQRQSAALLAQRTDARKQLDQSTADLAAAESQFSALCASLIREAPSEPKPAAGAEAAPPTAGAAPATTAQPANPVLAATATTAAPATGATAASTAGPTPPQGKVAGDKADKPDTAPETSPMITAAQFAALYQQLLQSEDQVEKEPASDAGKGAKSTRPAAPGASRDEIMTRIEELRRRFQFQHQGAQQIVQDRTADRDKVAREAERINQIDEAIADRKRSLAPENYDKDSQLQGLLERKAVLEAQYEADRAKLDEELAQMATLPRMLEEGQKIEQLEKSASALRALRMSRKTYRENYASTQAALDALTGPLNDMLNLSGQYDRIEQTYLKMDEWVRDVKLALSQISVNVYEAAEPTDPVRPNWPINIALSCVLGLMASFGTVVLIEFGRKTVKTPADAKRSLEAPVLGVVPHFRPLDFGNEVFSLDALKDSRVVETFNEIRFHIHAATEGRPPRSILVTSAAAQEGKTTVSTLLAHSLARSGKSVLLVDANLRVPYLHSVFHCDGKRGLADVLQNGTDLRSCVRPTEIQNLSLMTAGAAAEDGLAWVQPERFAQFIRAAYETFDHVILDSTSAIGVADVRIIASGVDAVIYVVQAGRFNSALVSRGVENIRGARANLLGVVLNNATYTKGDHYYFHKRAVARNGRSPTPADEEPAKPDSEGSGKT